MSLYSTAGQLPLGSCPFSTRKPHQMTSMLTAILGIRTRQQKENEYEHISLDMAKILNILPQITFFKETPCSAVLNQWCPEKFAKNSLESQSLRKSSFHAASNTHQNSKFL